MANVPGLPAVDLRELAGRIAGRPGWADRWIVMDGTMVSGGLDPFLWFSGPGQPSLLYYESGSK
ncbi:MAG TPA: hypothetical protein VKM72_06480, partial [Thermoanaerobaculia bacterium]|nr:hypothetical protein [Thermoanaerobaculia bacterium]